MTEYNFICPVCKKIIKSDEQYVIEIIQKKLNNYLLTEKEYTDNLQYEKINFKKKKYKKIVKVVFLCIFY